MHPSIYCSIQSYIYFSILSSIQAFLHITVPSLASAALATQWPATSHHQCGGRGVPDCECTGVVPMTRFSFEYNVVKTTPPCHSRVVGVIRVVLVVVESTADRRRSVCKKRKNETRDAGGGDGLTCVGTTIAGASALRFASSSLHCFSAASCSEYSLFTSR